MRLKSWHAVIRARGSLQLAATAQHCHLGQRDAQPFFNIHDACLFCSCV